MKVLTQSEVLSELCRITGKWGMRLSFKEVGDFTENLRAAPYLNIKDHAQVIAGGLGYILFDSEEELEAAFWQTVGDDGPTKTNPYAGPARVYALTCDPIGQLMHENT